MGEDGAAALKPSKKPAPWYHRQRLWYHGAVPPIIIRPVRWFWLGGDCLLVYIDEGASALACPGCWRLDIHTHICRSTSHRLKQLDPASKICHFNALYDILEAGGGRDPVSCEKSAE